METRSLIEALLYKIPNLRKAFLGLNIMNLERKISASEHPEFSNILKPFDKDLKIISIVSYIQITMLISHNKINRTYPVILIIGDSSEIKDFSKTKIASELLFYLRWKDYLPDPFIKKIIYISSYSKKLEGVVFSELDKNLWTIDSNPLKLPSPIGQKVTPKEIVNEILDEILR